MRFDSYHPVINLIFFTAVMTAAVLFDHPVFLLLSYLCPLVYSVALSGKRAAVFDLLLLLGMLAYTLYYASYNHFGITVLGSNFIGNQITLESLVFGLVRSIKAASLLMWFSCVHAVFTSDKVVYLFGRAAPRLSLYLAILLRLIPRIRAYAGKVHVAQKGIGRGLSQGGFFRRCRNFFRIAAIVITWVLESFIRTSDSMKSRGYTLKGRTAFSIYRFDYRDRGFVTALFVCFTVILMGVLLDQTRALYNPEIIINPITPLGVIFYLAYGGVCLMPMVLQIIGEQRFQSLTKKMK